MTRAGIEVFREIFYDLVGRYEYVYNREQTQVVYDSVTETSTVIPLYGEVKVPKYINFLALHPIVNRLREIKQLAYTHLFLVGATHSRFEHSLGVAHRVEGIFNKINGKYNGLLDKDDFILTQIAALLHDIGHPAWGHALDSITGYVVDILGDAGLYLFNFNKLDLAISIYLLLNNEQIINALNKVATKEIKNNNLSKYFNHIIAQIIAEEEEMLTDTLAELVEKNKSIARKIHLLTTIIGSYKEKGGINLDRLDWMIRDFHHTEYYEKLDEQVKQNFRNFVEKNRQNNFEIILKENEYFDVDDDFKRDRDDIRGKVYQRIYEGIERSFMDSVLTRLAYNVVNFIDKIGRKLASSSVRLRAIMAYLLMHDHEMLETTKNVLHVANEYKHLIISRSEEEPYGIFLSNTVNLIDLFESLYYIVHYLKNMSDITITKYGVNFKYTDIDSINLAILAFPSETLAEILSRLLSDDDSMFLIKIRHMVSAYMADIFKAINAQTCEYSVQNEIIEEIGREVSTVILPNYYFFRRLDRELNKKEMKTRDDVLELLKEGMVDTPFLFVLFSECIKDQTKWKKIAEIVYDSVYTRLSEQTQYLSGGKP